MDKNRLHRLAAMLKEASAGAEHERIRSDLDSWAQARNFPTSLNVSLPNGGRPDVLRFEATKKYLFIDDAKDSENETIRNPATMTRIAGYMIEFGNLIGEGDIQGGCFAIATNDVTEAQAWVDTLNLLATLQNLTDTAGSPNFQVTQIAEKTWVAWW